MANCFRCGREISQPKCDRCGFDPRSGVRLLTRWTGKYDIPKVEPKVAAQTTSSAAQQSQSSGTNQTRQSQTNADRMARLRRQIDIEDRVKTVLLVVAGLAALAGLIFGGYHLVRWMGTFSGYIWKVISGSAAAVAIAAVMIWSTAKTEYWIDQLNEFIGMPATVINLILMIIFPEAYGPIGALIAVGLGVGFAYLAYELIDYAEPGQGAACAVFMIANLMLFPHLWGTSWLGWLMYAVIVLICAGLAVAYVNNDWENPIVLQGAFAGIAAVFYLVGFLAMPHFMHALNEMPEFSEDRTVGQKKIEADCSCGETIEVGAFTEDLIHGTHCVFKFVFIPECEGDETGHWQICVCGETYNYQAHTYNDEGVCGFCQYPQDGVQIGGETDEATETHDEIESTGASTEEIESSADEETSGGSTEEESSEGEISTEDDITQGGVVEDPSKRPMDTPKTMSVRTVVIISAVVAVLLIAGAVVYYLSMSRSGSMRQLSVRGTDRLINFTVTGMYGLIVLTVAACAFLKVGVFGLNIVQLIIGLVLALVLAAVMIGTEQATDEYAAQTTISIILSVLNAAAMLIFPDGYCTIGALMSGGLAVSFAHLTFAGFDDYEAGWGGASAIFMAIDLLLVFLLFGISWLGWLVLITVVLLWIIVVVIYSCHTEAASGLQIGFGVFFLVASLCGYLFAPHFMHSLHGLPNLKEQGSASETEVAAECLCGDIVGVSVTTVDWVHSFHILKEGGSSEFGHNDKEHWKICVCGARYTYKKHVYNESGICEDCDHIEGEGALELYPNLSRIVYHGSRNQWAALNWPEKEQYEPFVTFIENN